MSKILIFITIIVLSALIAPIFVNAIEKKQDTTITLGEDLTISQKEKILNEMNIENEDEAEIIYVSNKEEHDYLGSYISPEQIGNNALSSAKITLKESGYGIQLETNNINYITEEMYKNALMTAGITDAEIYITAPFEVSGTGALTGVIKAYEHIHGEEIDEEIKQAANEEMVLTAELAENEEIGDEKATELINAIKEEIAENKPQDKEELRNIITNISIDLGITLSDDDLQKLVDFFDKIKGLNIDWDKINNTLSKAKDKLTEFAKSEEGQNFFRSLLDFLRNTWNAIVSFFSK